MKYIQQKELGIPGKEVSFMHE
jgi:hypothetical protein